MSTRPDRHLDQGSPWPRGFPRSLGQRSPRHLMNVGKQDASFGRDILGDEHNTTGKGAYLLVSRLCCQVVGKKARPSPRARWPPSVPSRDIIDNVTPRPHLDGGVPNIFAATRICFRGLNERSPRQLHTRLRHSSISMTTLHHGSFPCTVASALKKARTIGRPQWPQKVKGCRALDVALIHSSVDVCRYSFYISVLIV